MRFDYEEAELLNAFLESSKKLLPKDELISRINNSGNENTDPELIRIANSTITKLHNLDENTFNQIVADLPVDTYTIYR